MGLTERLEQAKQTLIGAWPALMVTGLAALAWAFEDAGRAALAFDREALSNGEFWRLLTGHLVHLGDSHTVFNILGMLLGWLLFGPYYSFREWVLITAVSVAAVDVGLWWLNPELEWYVGLSGVLHGWLVAGTVAALLERRPDGTLLAALVVGKLAFEQWQGPVPGSSQAAGGAVVYDAHLYGAVGGLAAALFLTRFGGRSRLYSAASRGPGGVRSEK